MELIAANRGVRSLNQPFSTLNRSATLTQVFALPRMHLGAFTSLDEDASRQMEQVIQQIFSGELVFAAPTKVWERDYSWRSDRLVLKITAAKPIIGWFDQHVDADIVYLSRHPIPQSLSCIRNG